MPTRRHFLATAATATLFAPAVSYANILGAADKLNTAVVGINGRGQALAAAIVASPNMALVALCDVDRRTFAKLRQGLGADYAAAKTLDEYKDYRKLLERKDLDVVAIATPEHWHMPMAMMALKAGKHVYLEKPCSFCPAEGEMLVAAQAKYGKQVQMGNQQRSARTSQEAIAAIHDGMIGKAYHGKAWYANKRSAIGPEVITDVPEWLDWDLWQGPAPRRAYANPWVHYNWHWHRNWGTGEINNNGTHEIDICRWALGVDYPTQVQSAGGRFHFDDAWQWFDTQQANYTYADGKLITWDGHSCVPTNTHGRGRGAWIGGTEGYAILDRNGATVYDLDGKVKLDLKEDEASATMNTVGEGSLDKLHMQNLADGILKGEPLRSPIADARISQWHCHVGNIAQDLCAVLRIDPATGKVIGNAAADAKWSREYAEGWAPTV